MRLTSAATLRALLQQKDVSYGELAASAKVSKGFISHLTSGRRNTCTPRVAEAIVRRLDVPTSILFVASASTAMGTNRKHQRRNAA
jgi:transcriptional regulator with XRE-family HTH domain